MGSRDSTRSRFAAGICLGIWTNSARRKALQSQKMVHLARPDGFGGLCEIEKRRMRKNKGRSRSRKREKEKRQCKERTNKKAKTDGKKRRGKV